VLLTILLGACSSLPWQGARHEAGVERAFELLGRVSVRHEGRVLTGMLRWQHTQARDEVWFSSPLGETFAHIVREPEGAVLTTADQQVWRASSVGALTREGLGWVFPLADLGHYVLGEAPPSRAADQVERDREGRVARISGDGWEVELAGDRVQPGGTPRRLRLKSAEVEIRLVVDRLALE